MIVSVCVMTGEKHRKLSASNSHRIFLTIFHRCKDKNLPYVQCQHCIYSSWAQISSSKMLLPKLNFSRGLWNICIFTLRSWKSTQNNWRGWCSAISRECSGFSQVLLCLWFSVKHNLQLIYVYINIYNILVCYFCSNRCKWM